MKDRPLIYVAGPYTNPDPVWNTHKMIMAGVALRDAGYTPLIPTLSLLTHMVSPHPPEYWYEWDLDMLEHCAEMLRLPGKSWGADREEVFARERGIPVFLGTAEAFINLRKGAA
jgi:hypothetical protein